MMAQADVVLTSIEKRYGKNVAVPDLSLSIEKGTFFSLLGPSGCGKTTTLRLIAGFERADRGTIEIGGRDVTRLPAYRRDFGMVFQNFALFPHMTVGENVGFGPRMKGVARRDIIERVREALTLVQLEDYIDRYPNQLSGGQQQRVALARAIVIKPPVLLLDEPLGALDKMLRDSMQTELRQLQRKLGITTVFVTHDQEEALTMSDRVAVMNEGVIEQIDSPGEIYERPRTEFVANFLGISNMFDGVVIEASGGRAVVDSRGDKFAFRDSRSAVGEHVRLIIRPEKIRIVKDGDPAALTKAQIVDSIYKGAQTTLRMERQGQRFTVLQQNTSRDQVSLEPGSVVGCVWDEGSMVRVA
jgi:putative spermidine/putrescine transport system ATP-binding protein/spermidine/putrescine transport system ATP-binding protein